MGFLLENSFWLGINMLKVRAPQQKSGCTPISIMHTNIDYAHQYRLCTPISIMHTNIDFLIKIQGRFGASLQRKGENARDATGVITRLAKMSIGTLQLTELTGYVFEI